MDKNGLGKIVTRLIFLDNSTNSTDSIDDRNGPMLERCFEGFYPLEMGDSVLFKYSGGITDSLKNDIRDGRSIREGHYRTRHRTIEAEKNNHYSGENESPILEVTYWLDRVEEFSKGPWFKRS